MDCLAYATASLRYPAQEPRRWDYLVPAVHCVKKGSNELGKPYLVNPTKLRGQSWGEALVLFQNVRTNAYPA